MVGEQEVRTLAVRGKPYHCVEFELGRLGAKGEDYRSIFLPGFRKQAQNLTCRTLRE